MTDRTHYHANLIFAVGTQVVTLRDVVGPQGARCIRVARSAWWSQPHETRNTPTVFAFPMVSRNRFRQAN